MYTLPCSCVKSQLKSITGKGGFNRVSPHNAPLTVSARMGAADVALDRPAAVRMARIIASATMVDVSPLKLGMANAGLSSAAFVVGEGPSGDQRDEQTETN